MTQNKTQIETLRTYYDVIDLARTNECTIVEEDYLQMADDLEYQIANDLNEGV